MKRATLVLVLVSACGVAIASPGWAQVDLAKRLSVSFNAVPPAMLFGFVAKMGRFEVTVDPALQKNVSITLADVKLRTFLDASCDSIGCTWSIDGNRLVVHALPPDASRGKGWIEPPGKTMPAGSRFVNVPVENVLEAISRAAGEGSVYSVEELDPHHMVTVDVSDQEVLRAIALLVKATGFTGTTYTVTLKRPGQKLTIIKTLIKEPDDEQSR